MPHPSQEVVTLPLPPSVRQRLLSCGFRLVADFNGVGPVDLSKEANISHEEALDVLTVAQGTESSNALAGAKSAAEILHAEKSKVPVSTMCPELDRLLGGGVSQGEITEFCGVPGIGKTQLGMQLAINAQVPVEHGGLGGHAIYIDTEGSLVAERVAEMADVVIHDLQHQSGQMITAQVLEQIHYFRVHNATEQRALLNSLDTFLKSHSQVRILIIDSIAFHYRQDFPDMSQRTRILNEASLLLMQLAHKRNLAVVTMNQVTTKVSPNQLSTLVPALGDSFAHACTTRIILFWKNGVRHAHLFKSPRLAQATVPYYVSADGIRGASQYSGHKRPYNST